MKDNLEVEETETFNENSSENSTESKMEPTQKSFSRNWSEKFFSASYSIIEPYYDLLIVNKKFRWLFLRLIQQLFHLHSSFFGTIGQFFSEIAIISMIETNSSGNAGFALGGVYVCFALPPIFLVRKSLFSQL
jgi:hypothetical protein